VILVPPYKCSGLLNYLLTYFRRKVTETGRSRARPGNTWLSVWHAQSSPPWSSREFSSEWSSSSTVPMKLCRYRRQWHCYGFHQVNKPISACYPGFRLALYLGYGRPM